MAITGLDNGLPHWETDPSEWDRLTLGPIVLPGVWDVEFEIKRNMDVKKPHGKDGGKFRDLGLEPTTVVLTGRLATRAHWLEWQRVLPEFNPAVKRKERRTFQLGHPSAHLLGLGKVYITSIRTPELNNGIFTISMSAIEYFAVLTPVKPQTKPTASARNLLDQDKDITGVPVALKKP